MKPLSQKLAQEYDEDDFSQEEPKYWGSEAAGCIFIAKDTGRILLSKRSSDVMEPGTWGTWGGKIDWGEAPKDAVIRELEEEVGYDGEYKLAHLWTYEDQEEGFEYHNFMALVPMEFRPKLNWENTHSKWVEFGEWPQPMHFGLKALLQNAGDKIEKVVKLIKRKQADVLEVADAPPPAIVQKEPATAPKPSQNIVDAYIVAATLWGEARGEGNKGMQSVMNVIMNRSKGDFNKARAVCLQPKQFSMWNKVSDPEAFAMKVAQKYREDNVWKDVIKIVDLAMKGQLKDVTGGATYYFNPSKANPGWAKRMIKTAAIGHHNFYKPMPKVKRKTHAPQKAAIREVLESQDANSAAIIKKGLVGIGQYEYELHSPFSFIRYRYEPDSKLFYLDSIVTPDEEHQGKGYAKALLESFFRLIKQYGGALDCDTYTTSGMTKIKPAVEYFAKKYRVRLVGAAPEDIDEAVVVGSSREDGKIIGSEKWLTHGFMFNANPGWKKKPHHDWRYGTTLKTLFWWDKNVPYELKKKTRDYLQQNGYEVKRESYIEPDTKAPTFKMAHYDEPVAESTSELSNFKSWFGNSKVVDKEGHPLTVFKGMTWKDDAGKDIKHIQRQSEFPSFHGDEPGIQIAGFFTNNEKVAKKFCWGKQSHIKAFNLKIENPWVIDMKGAAAGLAQFEAGGKPFRDAMRSGKYDGAILLNTWDEGDVFIIKDPRQAKLVGNTECNPNEKDFMREVDIYGGSSKLGKVKESDDTDPISKDTLVVLGTVFSDGHVRAKAGHSDVARHPADWGGNRWRYVPEIEMLNWWESPSEVEDKAVKAFLEKHGLPVARVSVFTVRRWNPKPAPGEIVAENLVMEASNATPEQLVEFIRAQIKGTEWEGKVFAVGGFVRDILLGKRPKDLDVVISVNQGGKLFTDWLGKKLGIYKEGSNPVIFPTFGTANLRLDGVVWNGIDFTGEAIDAVMFRKEQYHDPDSRKPTQVQFTPHIEVDAQRRDITFNALYMDISSGEILDPTGRGKEDLKNGIVDTAIDPTEIYTDDALRMFRAVRFAAQLGFKISPKVMDGIKKNLHRLGNTSRERVAVELNKILTGKYADYGMRLLRDTGLLPHIGPELQQMVGMTQNVHHKDDVFDHTLAVVMGTQPELLNRLIALFHDIGKVTTRAVTPKGVQFIGHEDAGPDIVEKIMMSLKYPRVTIDAVKLGVRHHMKLKHGGPDAVKLSDKTLRKFKIALGNYLEQLLDVMHADNISHADASAMPKQIEAVRARLKALDIQVTKPVLPINGNDLLALGVKPGPMVGKILNAVTEKWYENPNVSKEEAMHIAKSILNGSS